MRYKKINDATVQCIITAEDMLEYGLTLSDIFERNEKGEGFLRDIIERAHDEIGYQINGENIAMQITPLKDKGLVVTFTDESPMGFRDILQHLKDVPRESAMSLADRVRLQRSRQKCLMRTEGCSYLLHYIRRCSIRLQFPTVCQ